MTTGKRQIPINDHAPGDPVKTAHDQKSRTGSRAGASRKGAPESGTAAARNETSAGHNTPTQASGTQAGERDGLTADRDALAAERDGLLAERDALAAERDSLNDQLLRLRAEFENYRKRASREAFESHIRIQCEVMNDFLPVLDNLERALDAAEHHEEGKVLEGVRMTRDMFAGLLARSGVEEIEGVGARFDPQVHDAVAVQPSDQEEGLVAAVLERGYRQGDRVLRPARVMVSAGRAGSGSGSAPAAGSPDPGDVSATG